MGRASRRKRERLAHRLGVGAAEGEMPSSGKPKTTQEILKRTWDMLETARLGASVATDNPDPRHRISGVRNVIVFGRAVTNVLQNLRATELTFDAWYAPVVQRMETDPLMRFLYELQFIQKPHQRIGLHPLNNWRIPGVESKLCSPQILKHIRDRAAKYDDVSNA